MKFAVTLSNIQGRLTPSLTVSHGLRPIHIALESIQLTYALDVLTNGADYK